MTMRFFFFTDRIEYAKRFRTRIMAWITILKMKGTSTPLHPMTSEEDMIMAFGGKREAGIVKAEIETRIRGEIR